LLSIWAPARQGLVFWQVLQFAQSEGLRSAKIRCRHAFLLPFFCISILGQWFDFGRRQQQQPVAPFIVCVSRGIFPLSRRRRTSGESVGWTLCTHAGRRDCKSVFHGMVGDCRCMDDGGEVVSSTRGLFIFRSWSFRSVGILQKKNCCCVVLKDDCLINQPTKRLAILSETGMDTTDLIIRHGQKKSEKGFPKLRCQELN